MRQPDENLMELLLRFHEPDEARRIFDEIQQGDDLLEDLEPLRPDPVAMSRLKADLRPVLAAGTRRRRRRRFLATITAAAAVLVLGGLVQYLLRTYQPAPSPVAHNGSPAPAVPQAVESEFTPPEPWHIESDQEIAAITSELESVVDDILDVPVREYAENRENPLDAIEEEINALASVDNFWGEYHVP